MKHLDMIQMKEITDCMYPIEFEAGSVIIQEKEVGSVVYVLEDGKADVPQRDLNRSYLIDI